MRAKLGILIPLALLMVAGGVLNTTTASGQTVLTFETGPGGKSAFIDVHFDGLRLGDRAAARGPLHDAQGDRVGTFYLHCIVNKAITGPTTGLWNCNYVLELADGDIVLQGMDPRGPGEYEMAILGGTGAYAGARGDALFTDGGSEVDTTSMVIRLLD